MLFCATLLVACSDAYKNNEKQTDQTKENSSLVAETTTNESEEYETKKEINENYSYVPNGKTPEEIVKVVLDGVEYCRVYEDYTEDEILSDEVLKIERYRVVDLDNDGYNEVILDADTIGNNVILLHYEDGVVYGYEKGWRSTSSISLDGVIMGASGAASTHYYKVEFDKDSYSEINMESTKFEESVPYWTCFKWLVNTIEE